VKEARGPQQVIKSSSEKKGSMVQLHVVVVCSIVGFVGLVLVILGVASEASTVQIPELESDGFNVKCVYQTTPALGCGITAALLALAAQIAVTTTSLLCGCCRTWELPSGARRIVGIVISVVSWYIYFLKNKVHQLLRFYDFKCITCKFLEIKTDAYKYVNNKLLNM